MQTTIAFPQSGVSNQSLKNNLPPSRQHLLRSLPKEIPAWFIPMAYDHPGNHGISIRIVFEEYTVDRHLLYWQLACHALHENIDDQEVIQSITRLEVGALSDGNCSHGFLPISRIAEYLEWRLIKPLKC